MTNNTVTLLVGGREYFGWKTVKIKRSVEAISGSFELTLTEKWDDVAHQWRVFTEDPCQLYIGNDLVIDGYVDDVSRSASKAEFAISVAGRDKTKDLVDCSIVDTSTEFWGKKLSAIVEVIAKPYGITVKAAAGIDEHVPSFALQPGEKCYDAINRLCKLYGVLPSSTPDGAVYLTRSGITRASSDLTLGPSGNIFSASVQEKSIERYSKYTVIGNVQSTDESEPFYDISVRGSTIDPEISRRREIVIVSDNVLSNSAAKKRSAWEAAVRAGKALTLAVSTAGWRQADGALWWPNMLVGVDIPALYINGATLLICDILFSLSLAEGEVAEMTLRRPDAYLPDQINPKQKTDPFADIRAARVAGEK